MKVFNMNYSKLQITKDIISHHKKQQQKKYKNINVTSELSSNEESTFPTVLVYEMDNYVYTPTLDSSLQENDARVVYQVEVYTKAKSVSKIKAKKILNDVDSLLGAIGFIRTVKTQIDTGYTDMTRLVARYQAIINKQGYISN